MSTVPAEAVDDGISSLELELQTAGSHPVGTGSRIWVLCESGQCSQLLSGLSRAHIWVFYGENKGLRLPSVRLRSDPVLTGIDPIRTRTSSFHSNRDDREDRVGFIDGPPPRLLKSAPLCCPLQGFKDLTSALWDIQQ